MIILDEKRKKRQTSEGGVLQRKTQNNFSLGYWMIAICMNIWPIITNYYFSFSPFSISVLIASYVPSTFFPPVIAVDVLRMIW